MKRSRKQHDEVARQHGGESSKDTDMGVDGKANISSRDDKIAQVIHNQAVGYYDGQHHQFYKEKGRCSDLSAMYFSDRC